MQQRNTDPAYIDALLSTLTDQRNAALNENVILIASNKQLLVKIAETEKAREALAQEVVKLKTELEALTPKAPE